MQKQYHILLSAIFVLFACNVSNIHKHIDETFLLSIKRVTAICKSNEYIKAKNEIQALSVDGFEHAIAFGKDIDGNVVSSAISGGNSFTTFIPGVINKFADMHNHPNNKPPYSGDIYGFIDLVAANKLFEARYILTANGTVYALIITDLQAAIEFDKNYPRVANLKGFEPTFPEAIVDEVNKLKNWHDATEEIALAFVLEKYNAGIALLKQDSKGDFKKIGTGKKMDANGNRMYNKSNC